MPSVADIVNGEGVLMTQQDKDYLSNKKLTTSLIIGCLTTCESVISKNAYLEKKWSNYQLCSEVTSGDTYKSERLKWMDYRRTLQRVLLYKKSIPMKQIIQMTKGCKDKSTQKQVVEVTKLIESDDYTLI